MMLTSADIPSTQTVHAADRPHVIAELQALKLINLKLILFNDANNKCIELCGNWYFYLISVLVSNFIKRIWNESAKHPAWHAQFSLASWLSGCSSSQTGWPSCTALSALCHFAYRHCRYPIEDFRGIRC